MIRVPSTIFVFCVCFTYRLLATNPRLSDLNRQIAEIIEYLDERDGAEEERNHDAFAWKNLGTKSTTYCFRSFTRKQSPLPVLQALWISSLIYFVLAGYLYQSKDTLFHDGGAMQPFALNAFNKALELDNESSEHVVQVNQQKG